MISEDVQRVYVQSPCGGKGNVLEQIAWGVCADDDLPPPTALQAAQKTGSRTDQMDVLDVMASDRIA